MRGVVAADADHLAARDDRREQPDVVQLPLLPGELDRQGHGVAGQHRDRVGMLAAVLGELDQPNWGSPPAAKRAMRIPSAYPRPATADSAAYS